MWAEVNFSGFFFKCCHLLLSGSAVVHELKPSEARKFVWDDPTRPRMLRWSYMEHSGELNLLKVGFRAQNPESGSAVGFFRSPTQRGWSSPLSPPVCSVWGLHRTPFGTLSEECYFGNLKPFQAPKNTFTKKQKMNRTL